MIKRAPLKDNPDNYYSYFYINNRSASFSEFIDILNHARIAGEGYNIIKQGDVTSLVEMGSVDRRKIIDSSAGISTFDEDIEKANKEHEDVDKNLERIDIILNEITSQIRQLKKDRDAAYRYKELKDQLYETKAKIAYKKKQEVESQILEVNRQIESYEGEQKKFEDLKEKLKTQYRELQQKLNEGEKKIVGGDALRVEAIQGFHQRRADALIVSDHLWICASVHDVFRVIAAHNGDALATAGDHESGVPGQLQHLADNQRQAGIVHVACLAHERQQQIDVFLLQNLHRLVNFLEDDFAIGHEAGS